VGAVKNNPQAPDVHGSVGVTGSGVLTQYWAALFRDGHIERSRGPFVTADAAYAAFLPVKAWPKQERVGGCRG
jgi:hypothetical protein